VKLAEQAGVNIFARFQRATRWGPATAHTPAMQEDATLRILDHGSNTGTYDQSGFLRHWVLELMRFLLPPDWLVAALAETAVDEILGDRAGPAGLEETAENPAVAPVPPPAAVLPAIVPAGFNLAYSSAKCLQSAMSRSACS
jgi:hypothetical protein